MSFDESSGLTLFAIFKRFRSDENGVFAWWDSHVDKMPSKDLEGLRVIEGGSLESEDFVCVIFSNKPISLDEAQGIMLANEPEKGSHSSGVGSYRDQLFKQGDTVVREIYIPAGYKMLITKQTA